MRPLAAALLSFSFTVLGETPPADSIEKQRRSVARQLEAVARQAKTARIQERAKETVDRPAVCDPLPEDELSRLAEQTGTRHGLSGELIRAVIRQESGGYACAVSPKGALGLMQIMPDAADEIGLTEPFDAERNVDAGGKILKRLLTKFSGDLALTLAAYNAGEGAVDRAAGIPDYPETRQYVSAVLAALGVR